MRTTVVLFAFAVALAHTGVADTGHFSRRVWRTQDGLPRDGVRALEQTEDGYLWIATSGGLVRFDGFQFRTFNLENTPALREESLSSLYAARDGSLWIGTDGGGLVRYRQGSFDRFGEEEGLTNGFVRSVVEDAQGRLWAGADGGLFLFEGGRWRLARDSGRILPRSVFTFHQDRTGRFWVAGSGFYYFDAGRVVRVTSPWGVATNAARDMAETTDGSLWAATVGGLFRGRLDEPASLFASEPLLPNATSLLTTRAGELWAGTYGHGLYRISSEKLEKYGAPHDLPDNHISALFEDREGNLWVGTQNGLLRMSRSVARTIPLGEPGVAESVKTIYEDPDGGLWMTTSSGELYRMQGERVERVKLAGGAIENYRLVYRDRSGALWAGSNGQGVWRIFEGRVRRYSMRDGLVNNFIRAFYETADGSLWIGTDSGLSRFRDGEFESFHTQDGLAYGSVRVLLEDRRGSLWIGTDRGVSRYENGRLFHDPRLADLDDEKVWTMYEDPDGGVWFGTHGNGLFRLEGDRLDRFGVEHGLASNNIHQILEGPDGVVWLAGSAGVCSVRRTDLERILEDPDYRPAVTLYGLSEGLETNQIWGGLQPSATIASDGGVWLPSTRGPVRIASEPRRETFTPLVLIERVLADGEEKPIGRWVDVEPGEGRLEIQYTAIRLRSSERIRFWYRLKGLEDLWTEAGGRRVAYYTNVPPGEYEFQVVANESHVPDYAAAVALPLRLAPHFYQTSWFLLLCVTAVIGAAVVAYRLRLRQLEARFAAVLAERTRLAREMHDTLIQGCVGVAALLDASASLERSAPERSSELTAHARKQIRVAVNDARRAVWHLRHGAGDGEDLAETLERLVHQIGKASRVPISFASSGKRVRLNAHREHDLAMIVREALLNAVQHGAPDQVRVTIHFEPERVVVLVKDDGCGFDVQSVSEETEHYGVIGMAERARQIGAKLSIESRPGQGTEVRVETPVKAHEVRGVVRQ